MISKAFVINMPVSKERYRLFLEESKNTGIPIERINGVDARNYIKYGNNLAVHSINGQVLQDRNYISGSLGCAFAHLNALKLADKAGYDNILIFEDDVQIVKYFDDYIYKAMQQLPSDWAMLRLHRSTTSLPSKKEYSGDLFRVYEGDGIYGIVVNKSYYKKFISIIEDEIKLFDKHGAMRTIDTVYSSKMHELPVYETKKILVYHREGFSERMNCYYNYGRQKPDGIEIEEQKLMQLHNGKIGIGITTFRRPHIFKKTIEEFEKFLPPNYLLYVNDDTEDCEGVAISKNKCLEALCDCEYIFLFDDDIYPVANNWWQPFIDAYKETGNEHFCLTFEKFVTGIGCGNVLQKTEGNLEYFLHPDGKLLFFTNNCIRKAGGMDCGYGRYGNEHVGTSLRIFKLGLTKYPYISVKDTLKLFHSSDYYREVDCSLSVEERKSCKAQSDSMLSFDSVEAQWKPFKKEDFVCTIFMTNARYNYGNWKNIPDIGLIKAWAMSLIDKEMTGIVFHNCFTDEDIDSFKRYPVKFIKEELPSGLMTGLYRYKLYDKFVNRFRRYINNIWLTDSTDLTVLKNPITDTEFSKELIYVGDEGITRERNHWVTSASQGFHEYPSLMLQSPEFRNKNVLNAGLIGGYVNTVAPFLSAVNEHCKRMYSDSNVQDMPIVNYVAWQPEFRNKIYEGTHLNTIFNKYEANNKVAWFKHK